MATRKSETVPQRKDGDSSQAATIAGPHVSLSLLINGAERRLSIEPRVTLLDALRERLALPGAKKGCDHGQCGACTVLIDGRRVLACLTLALACEGKAITTIEGLAVDGSLHPLQQAFIDHDAFQCGFCTPGQILSAVACIAEGHAGDEAEIREFMSGNLCRCAAYPNIVAAIREVAAKGDSPLRWGHLPPVGGDSPPGREGPGGGSSGGGRARGGGNVNAPL